MGGKRRSRLSFFFGGRTPTTPSKAAFDEEELSEMKAKASKVTTGSGSNMLLSPAMAASTTPKLEPRRDIVLAPEEAMALMARTKANGQGVNGANDMQQKVEV